ncbi:MAG: hypothetical protein DME72_04470 [Verrucomicrobia bacterium]|nr:MAG: hypothetical protein DME72_04470 [Verrucomicrobiota bacterium]
MSQTLWNDENLIGPGVLDFAARRITAHVHISPTGIEWAHNVWQLEIPVVQKKHASTAVLFSLATSPCDLHAGEQLMNRLGFFWLQSEAAAARLPILAPEPAGPAW